MLRRNNREHKSIIQSFLTYVVKQHDDCSDQNILLVPCGWEEI